MKAISSHITYKYKHLSGWRKSALFAISSLALLSANKALFAENSSDISAQRLGTGNLQRGKEKSVDGRCQECHGTDGMSMDDKTPNHAGQYAAYLVKQLHNFQSGARVHNVMNIMAEDLTVTDIADIATYFANQKPMKGENSTDNPVANTLFNTGDATRGIPACKSCHGENGQGKIAIDAIYPMIGGQRSVYLRNQLINWKSNERHNSPNGVMNNVAHLLTDSEINSLADYISGL